jgi:uncharacterized repeat protein (TIGR01451 family)
MVGGFIAALMIGGAATGALLTSSEGGDTEPPTSVAGADNGAVELLAADLTLSKTAPETVKLGEEIAYVITVTNAGDEAADVHLTDELPDGAEFESLDDEGEDCTVEAQFVECTVPQLAGGSSVSWTIHTTATEAGTIENSALLDRPDQEPLTAKASTRVTADAAIEIVKTAPESATVGQVFQYTLSVANIGDVGLNDMRVVDELPDAVTFVEFVGATGDACDEEGGVVTCGPDTLSSGTIFHFEFRVRANLAGELVNSAAVTAKRDSGEELQDSDSATTIVSDEGAIADLALEKSAPPTAVAGTTFTYTLRVDNNGTTDIDGVEVEDDLPDGVAFAGSDDVCEAVEDIVTCDVGTVDADTSETVSFDVTASTTGTKTNTATVNLNGDLNPDDNTDSATTTVSAAPTSGEKVLIFEPTNSSGLRAAADRAGYAYDIKNATEWAAMTTAQFASYRAILIGDPSCGSLPTITAPIANRAVWAAAVDGNVIIDGTDPVFHGKNDFTNGAVGFATAASDRTGAYISLSCYYDSVAPNTAVQLLEPFGAFTVRGVDCASAVHIVADHSALSGINDAYMSGWGCSVHEAFQTWPTSFSVLAIAKDVGTAYTATDGTVGTPYILARGEGLTVISNVTVTTDAAPAATGTTRMVTATVKESGTPVVGKPVTFRVIEGPHVGTTATATTDTNGVATFAYTGTGTGTDAIEASYVDSAGLTQTSNRVFTSWTPGTAPPAPPSGGGGGGGGGGGSTTTTTTTTAPPLPPLPPPTNPQELNARVVMGQVLVNGQPFTGASLKVGDVVDTTRGTLELRSTNGNLLVYDGAFRYTLDGTIAQFELVGGDFSICQAARRAAGRSDDRPVRRLWGKGTGSFKTKARFSSATVRGTTWLTEDRCDGSLTQSDEGTVEVNDFSLRRLLLVAAGNRYLAQAPPPPTPGRFVGDPTGTVLINGQPVTQDTQVRNGDTVDVRNGRLLLRTTSGAATFYSGRFTVTQANSRTAFTLLRLAGGNFATTCGAARKTAAVDKDKPKKTKRKKNSAVVRSLWGDGTGKFRTQARYSSATVRGTIWLTVDRCDGSLVRVVRGRVEVRDLTQRKTVFVNAGGEYLAPAPG